MSWREIEVFNPQAWDSRLRRESWQVYILFFCKLRSLNWFQTFNTFFWLLLVPDPCTLKKHSFLFPFSLLKNWGDCLFCGGGGGGGVEMLFRFALVPIKCYSLFSFFFIQNCKRWEGGWFWGNFLLVGGRSWVQGPESRVQCTVQSRFTICPKDDMTSRQGNTTNQQDNRTSRQDDTTRRQDNRTSRQDDTTNRQDDGTSRQSRWHNKSARWQKK